MIKINGVQIGADEPLWIVNIKKSIASQLQLDITGVRGDGSSYKSATKAGDKSTFSVFEVKPWLNNEVLFKSVSL